jgi:hypothetical protein
MRFIQRSFGAALLVIATGTALAQPRIAIADGDTIDFGTVPPGMLIREIHLVNTGDQPLHIDRVDPDCGCTLAPLDRLDLIPGDSATMRITIDMSHRTGIVTQHVTIHSNDPVRPKQSVAILAEVVREISTGGSRFPTIWNAEAGKESTTSLPLQNNSDRPVTFHAARMTGNDGLEMRANLPEGLVLAPGASFLLGVTVKPERKGLLRGRVVIATSSERTPEISLQVICIVRTEPAEEAATR